MRAEQKKYDAKIGRIEAKEHCEQTEALVMLSWESKAGHEHLHTIASSSFGTCLDHYYERRQGKQDICV